MTSSPNPLPILDEAFVRRVAHIIGPNSAAAKAIEERDRRRAAGEDAVILQGDGCLLVGPRPNATILTFGPPVEDDGWVEKPGA